MFFFFFLKKKKTKAQLDHLASARPDLWSLSAFVETYIEKLTPVSMTKYRNVTWDDIPIDERKGFLTVLYTWACQYLDQPVQRSLKSSILFAFVNLLQQEDKYHFEAFLEYLNIPRKSQFNSKLVQTFEKTTKKEWGYGTLAEFGHSYSFFNGYRNTPRWTATSDETLVKEFLMKLFTDESSWHALLQSEMKTQFAKQFVEKNGKKSIREAFQELIDDTVLEQWEAEGYLYSGQTANAANYIEKLNKLQGLNYVNLLKSFVHVCTFFFFLAMQQSITCTACFNKKNIVYAVELEFVESNPKYVDMKTPIEIEVIAKNTGEILCKVFEINTKSYFREKQTDLKSDMELDGFHAAHEWVTTPTFNHPFHRVRVKISLPSELQKKRGVVFIDLIANGQHSRAIIRRGEIRTIERITARGHTFQMLDESGELIKNGTIWMSGHAYHSDDKGEIDIPFSTDPKPQKIVLQRNDDPEFNVLSSFDHKSESYELQCGFYLDREQIIAKKVATVLVRPGILLNGFRTTVKIIERPKLSIEIKTSDSQGVNKTFNNFKLSDGAESVAKISIPMNTTEVCVRLECQVTNQSQNKKVGLEKSQTFRVNGIHQTSQIESFHLIPAAADASFLVALYGKTGEGIARAVCKLELTHHFFTKPIELDVMTDHAGHIHLPAMHGFQALEVSHGTVRAKWDLECTLTINDTPRTVHMIEGGALHIPFVLNHHTSSSSDAKSAKLLLWDELHANIFPEHVHYDATHKEIVVHKLKAGVYTLAVFGHSRHITIHVTQGKLLDNNFVVNNNEILQLSNDRLLQISHIVGNKKDGVQIILNGFGSYIN
ncbi:hypothetical protein RFI_18641 [Reticulomyxa filosa]|uniref:Uncharacterized protein n=1 Tax=Reticulomyxa filosa TaxID=46433 RepID=X6MYQ4_RETFI|nr:hypothetical protein RFI_18641 [Reticulomyxa filosa]|eukprot:ETO18619.1 hypothetical protein RFI_18641 [Reticulomyxa filosa]